MSISDKDKQITELFFARDERALKEFTARYGPFCISAARSLLQNEQDAEECFNDLLLRLWESIPPQKPESYKAYAGKIIRNLSLNLLQKQNRAKRSAVLCELDECSAGEITDREPDLSGALNAFLKTLNRRDAFMFIRRYWYSDPIPDIAAGLGISENAVYKRLSACRGKLKKYLEKEGLAI